MRYQVLIDKIDLADELEKEFIKEARVALRAAAEILLKESQALIARHGPRGPAPAGQTPATVTGDLLRMTKTIPVWVRARGRHASSGVRYAPHAHLLEYGHVNVDGTRTLPRPFVRTAMMNVEVPISKLLEERLG